MNKFDQLNHAIQQSKNIVVLTGAGISTESGLPDFRSGKGIYNEAPETILSETYFYKHTDIFYEFLEKKLVHKNVMPNNGHKFLADLEKKGKNVTIITQNIDGLHQMAGSTNVIEFHGTLQTCSCISCQKQYSIDEVYERRNVKNDFYVCDCGKLIKPHIVLYDEVGEWFEDHKFYQLKCMMYDADLVLILGTTLKVSPFNLLPLFKNPDLPTPIFIINKGKTEFDYYRSVVKLDESISETLKKIDI